MVQERVLEGNVFRPIGVASWATPFELDRARAEWRERLEWLAPSRPWTVVAIGGNQHENPYLIAYARDLAVRLRRLHERIGGTLLLATSRRTPEDAISKLDQALRGIPYRVADWRGPERNNFYRGALAMADRVIATGDSLSMMSDALAAGKPLFVHAPAGSTRPEHDRMIHALFVRGLARPFTGADEAFAAPPAFNVADQIATEVQRRFSRGSCRAFFRRP